MHARRGVTMVEILVALSLGTLVIGAALMAWSGGLKAGRSSQVSVSVTAIALLETQLVADAVLLGVDPALGRVMSAKPDRIAFYRCAFAPGKEGPVRLRPVGYDLVATPGGNQRLRRSEAGQARMVEGVVLSGTRFEVVDDPGGQLLRFSATVLDGDEAGARGTPMVLLLPIPVPDDAGNPALARAARVQSEGPLPF
jgi:hypothetical protein